MSQRIREIMTRPPVAVQPQTPVADVARRMREENIGDVLVTEGDRLRGLVTDRDLVVRAFAEGGNPGLAHRADRPPASWRGPRSRANEAANRQKTTPPLSQRSRQR